MTPHSLEFSRLPMGTPILTLCLYLLVFICPLQLWAQPVFETFVTNKGKTATAPVNRPSGVVANDLLVVGLTFDKGSAEIISPPAGWTLIRRTNNSTDNGIATYYKVAGVSEPSSYTFTLTNGSI